jgi:3-hydroxybutyryl-CoA dehydrogenase
MAINTIGVVGAGTMGTGIAQVAAVSGFEVTVYDESAAARAKSIDTIKRLSASSVAKGRITEDDREAMLGRLHYADELGELAGADLVVEAVVEVLDVKLRIFRELDALLAPGAIIASNTSSMSITSLAAATGRPAGVAGLHFFNPAQVMKLVEIVRGYHTSDETVRLLRELCGRLGKTGIEVKRDTPGFVVNRLLMPQLREAVKILEEGVASKEDIDAAVKLGLNHPMGPFELQDLTGIDICFNILDYFRAELGDEYAPPVLMKQMVNAGRLGRKTGQGWYDYTQTR